MLNKFTNRLAVLMAIASMTCVSQATEILYAQDYGPGDASIATVLAGDGHSVTSALGGYAAGVNSDLLGDLSAYGAVFWSASGAGFGSTHDVAQFTDLLTFANNGGYVFVTGYDTIASPADPNLINFLGGSGSTDFGGARDPGAVTGANSLSTGLFDIQGALPTGAWGDWDTLLGLGGDTTCVASTDGGPAGGCQWSLRSLGLGQIAYLSAGASGTNIDGVWSDPASAYNNALRNFAYNAGSGSDTSVPEPGSLALLGVGLLGLSLARKTRQI